MFLCTSVEFYPEGLKCPSSCSESAYRVQTKQILRNMGCPMASSRLPSMGSGCTQPGLGGSGPIYLPTRSHFGKVVAKVKDYPCRRIILQVAKHALVLDLVAMSSHLKKMKKKAIIFFHLRGPLQGLNSHLFSPTSEQVCEKGGRSRVGNCWQPGHWQLTDATDCCPSLGH